MSDESVVQGCTQACFGMVDFFNLKPGPEPQKVTKWASIDNAGTELLPLIRAVANEHHTGFRVEPGGRFAFIGYEHGVDSALCEVATVVDEYRELCPQVSLRAWYERRQALIAAGRAELEEFA